jgi:hypothetical protein
MLPYISRSVQCALLYPIHTPSPLQTCILIHNISTTYFTPTTLLFTTVNRQVSSHHSISLRANPLASNKNGLSSIPRTLFRLCGHGSLDLCISLSTCMGQSQLPRRYYRRSKHTIRYFRTMHHWTKLWFFDRLQSSCTRC